MKKIGYFIGILAVLALIMLIAGCGDDDGDDTPPPPTPSCAEQGGEICISGEEECRGEFIKAKEAECCRGMCVTFTEGDSNETCAEQGGEICSIEEGCYSGYIIQSIEEGCCFMGNCCERIIVENISLMSDNNSINVDVEQLQGLTEQMRVWYGEKVGEFERISFVDASLVGTNIYSVVIEEIKYKFKVLIPDPNVCEIEVIVEEPPTTSCTDSDDGRDYYVKGTTQDSTTTKTDNCFDDNITINEYYCVDDTAEQINYNCPNGCSDGVCVGQFISNESLYLPPNQYSTISGCDPFLGNPNTPLKVIFVNLGNVTYFNEIKEDIINNQLKSISPFKENFNSVVLYSVEIEREANMGCSGLGSGLGSSGFACDNEKVYAKIKEKCLVDDFRGIITVVVAETEYGGSGGDVIYLGSSSTRDVDTQIALSKNIAVHEIGHNFGLADLYYGTFYYSGQPSQFWPTEFSRAFLNVDGPGCKKWCGSYKPASEYNQSISSQCLKFLDNSTCVSFGRGQDRWCNYTGNYPDCCVWSDEKFEYFNANCVPAFGSENIGIDCFEDSGCYYGAVYGNYAWRPVLNQEDSIMFSISSNKFDAVSQRELNSIFNCCLSSNSLSSDCTSFRKEYSDFLQNYNFKKRIGSCGYKEIPTLNQSCTDSDSGWDYYTKGSMDYGGITYTDYCQLKIPYTPRDEAYKVSSCNVEEGCYLIENYCGSEQKGNWEGYKCSNGCSDGACISNETTST